MNSAPNMVATSQPDAVEVGLEVLRSGGNAVDAAIASAMALTVVEPCSNGIGSDAFAIVWHEGRLYGLGASGRSPASWSTELFAGLDRMPVFGWDAITVPGAVSSWVALQQRFGTMDLPTLAAGAIRLARNGYTVTPLTAASWAKAVDRYREFPEWQRIFAPNGRAPRAGEQFRSEDHARTLEDISQTNGESFYRGDLARQISACAQEAGAHLSLEDLASHQYEWNEPLATPFRDSMLHELPPNGQGLVALVAAGILDQFDHRTTDPFDPISLHLQIEAMKLAFTDVKAIVGCPDSMTVDPQSLLQSESLSAYADSIDPDTALDPGDVMVFDPSTVYLCTADAGGTMVSFIQSNYMGFGSGVVIPGTGISMQNRGAGFVLEPGHPNQVGGGKRPFHTIIPGFVTRDGEPDIALGVMGGHMQPQGHLQVLWRIVELGQDPQTALDAPRWRIGEGRRVLLEPGFPASTIEALVVRGHDVAIPEAGTVFFGGGQAIHRIDCGYIGGSDHRRDGTVGGF